MRRWRTREIEHVGQSFAKELIEYKIYVDAMEVAILLNGISTKNARLSIRVGQNSHNISEFSLYKMVNEE